MISSWLLNGALYEDLYRKVIEPFLGMQQKFATNREGNLSPKEILCFDAKSSDLSFTLQTKFYNEQNVLDYILPIYGFDDDLVYAWIILMDSGRNTCNG
jgi:hypothetical protein